MFITIVVIHMLLDKKFILASNSASRKMLLKNAGLSFFTKKPLCDENYIKNQLLTKKILNEDDLSKIDSNIRLEISELAEKATKAEVPKEEELYNNVLSS